MMDFSTSAGAVSNSSMNNFSFFTPGFNFTNVINKGVDVIAALLVLVFFLILVWSLFEWFNAGGQPEFVLKAKRKVANAVLGIGIVFLSDFVAEFLILNISGIISNIRF